jgi:hypothetical protein
MKKNNKMVIIILLIVLLIGCQSTEVHPQSSSGKKYQTERVIILVIDGPRYSETWGDKTHQYIPHMAKDLAPSGVIFTNFYNDGFTYTTSGHAALCTGVRQELENSKGQDLPRQPSIFQHYLKESGLPASKAWLITSKDKLFILGNSSAPAWNNQYNPSSSCGKSGALSGYTQDTVTFNRIINVLKTDQPNLVLVNFKEPDGAGHANDWPGYLKGIVETDSLVWEVWKFIQTDPYYKDKTTLFITNDHGRHPDGWKDGFVSHGDNCDGCKHINLFAFGPDFKQNTIEKSYCFQVDVPATTAELLGFKMPYGTGTVLKKLFK